MSHDGICGGGGYDRVCQCLGCACPALDKEDLMSICQDGISSEGDSSCWYGVADLAFVLADRLGAVCNWQCHPSVREIG